MFFYYLYTDHNLIFCPEIFLSSQLFFSNELEKEAVNVIVFQLCDI